jgi:bile acid:Na+ symporter, BASS family
LHGRDIERLANASNPALSPLRALLRGGLEFLAASARHGSALLAAGIFGGVLIPPLARAFHPVIAPSVVALMTLVLLRVDIAAAFSHLRRPLRVAAVVAFQLLACPVIAWAAVLPLHLDPGIADGVVIFATGCAATSSPAFARIVGLDPELTLLATLATTLLVPLTAPPMAHALMGVDMALGVGAFMARLAVVVGLPLALSLLIRGLAGQARLAPLGGAVDGAVVWLVVLYGFGVMDGLAARMATDPVWVAQALAAAFAVDFGLNLATTAAFAWMGGREAASAGLMSGNRNMALYLAVLPAAADPRLALFFALCQFPLFLSPFLLRPLYRRFLAPHPTRA